MFGLPPIGKTEGPDINNGPGFDHKLSVAFALETIIRGAKVKGFNLKEILPTSCFEQNGRILKPQMREMLARMRIQLTDENFRRLWEQKFDLEGIGSIPTKQLIDQLGLTPDGTPKSEDVKVSDYRFPDQHRAKYKSFNGSAPLSKPNPCPPMVMDPIPVKATSETPAPKQEAKEEPTNQLPVLESLPHGIRYKDQLLRVLQNRPRSRNIILQLKYIFEARYKALTQVFELLDKDRKGSVPEDQLLVVLRECGLSVEPEELRRFALRLSLFADASVGACENPKTKGIGMNYIKLLRQLKCAPPSKNLNNINRVNRGPDNDPCSWSNRAKSNRYLEDEIFNAVYKEYLYFVERLEKVSKGQCVPLRDFREIVESTVGFTMNECQWEEVNRQLRIRPRNTVDMHHFLAHFSKMCKESPWEVLETPQIRQLDEEQQARLEYAGEPRDINLVLFALEKLISEKFCKIDKVWIGFGLCPVELDAIWSLLDEREPSTNGLHNYRKVIRFLLETGGIRFYQSMARRNKRLHDPNLVKMKDFWRCQRKYKKEHTKEVLALGKAAKEIKYVRKQKEKPSAERVEQLCQKIRPVVVANWTDLRNGFLWQDPNGWGSMLRKDFRKVCAAFNFPLSQEELCELAHGLDKKNDGYVQYVDFLGRFAKGYVPPKIGYKFDIVHHKLKNKKDGKEIGIREVMDKLRQICLSEYNTLLAGFRAIAGSRHADCIKAKDLGAFLKKHGIDLAEDCLYHLCTAYDKHRRGYITYTDFLQQTMDVTKPPN
ncbi:unnamed protein product [Mesocestoides corti]|uniref:EF-hand domain-containing protein n=1 Tax=Mesocestoides corti TaxID=53468 RepID=A0A0R3UMD4_MESCO|nr:unnamed protein product [Mesocestoides corti]